MEDKVDEDSVSTNFNDEIKETTEFIERAKKLLISYSKKAPKDATEKIEIIKGA